MTGGLGTVSTSNVTGVNVVCTLESSPPISIYTPTHFVTANASGSGDGSQGNPWTLQQAMGLAQAGNVVQVGPGVYSGPTTNRATAPVFEPVNTGTPGSPLIFFAQFPAASENNPANRSKLRRLGAANCPVLGIGYGGRRQNIVFDGFWFDYADGGEAMPRGIFYLGAENPNITVRRFRFDRVNLGPNDDGDNYNCVHLHGAASFTLTDSRFVGGYDANGSHNESAVTTYGVSNVRIEHNSFENVTTGIYVKGSNDNVGNGGVVRFNRFYGMRYGIEMSTAGAAGVDVSHNLFYDWNQTGSIQAVAFENAAGVNNVNFRFVNNTIILAPSSGGGVVLETGINMSGNVFRDNIVAALEANSQVLVNAWEVPNLSPFVSWDHNFYFNNGATPTFAVGGAIYTGLPAWQSASGRDANAVVANPNFMNAGAHDYRLSAGSPALTASSTGGPVGAYVTGTEEIGPRAAPVP